MSDELVSTGIRDRDIPVIDAIPVDDRTEHQKFADGLRELARFVESHPEMAVPCEQTFYIFPKKEEVGKYARILGRSKKRVSDTYFDLVREFPPAAKIQVTWGRDEVCERVVVGTVTVEEPVMVQQGTKTVTREKVEWKCPKVLEPPGLPSAADLDAVEGEKAIAAGDWERP